MAPPKKQRRPISCAKCKVDPKTGHTFEPLKSMLDQMTLDDRLWLLRGLSDGTIEAAVVVPPSFRLCRWKYTEEATRRKYSARDERRDYGQVIRVHENPFTETFADGEVTFWVMHVRQQISRTSVSHEAMVFCGKGCARATRIKLGFTDKKRLALPTSEIRRYVHGWLYRWVKGHGLYIGVAETQAKALRAAKERQKLGKKRAKKKRPSATPKVVFARFVAACAGKYFGDARYVGPLEGKIEDIEANHRDVNAYHCCAANLDPLRLSLHDRLPQDPGKLGENVIMVGGSKAWHREDHGSASSPIQRPPTGALGIPFEFGFNDQARIVEIVCQKIEARLRAKGKKPTASDIQDVLNLLARASDLLPEGYEDLLPSPRPL